MEGIFTRKISKKALVLYILGAVFLIFAGVKVFSLEAGANLVILLFGVWALGCAVYAASVVAFFLNNRGAFLKMEDSRITARYGFGKELDCSPEELGYAAVGANMLTLEAGGVIHDIGGLANVGDLANWLKERVPFVVPGESKEELLSCREAARRSRKVNLILGCVFCALAVFLYIIAQHYLKGKDLFTLTSTHIAVFAVYLAGVVIALIAGILCIRKVSHAIRQLTVSRDKLRCLAIAKTPLPEHDVIGVFYDGYAVRLSLCADPEDRVYYVSEKMGNDFSLHPHKSCDPCEDTTEVDLIIEQMRDIGFLFGLE